MFFLKKTFSSFASTLSAVKKNRGANPTCVDQAANPDLLLYDVLASKSHDSIHSATYRLNMFHPNSVTLYKYKFPIQFGEAGAQLYI